MFYDYNAYVNSISVKYLDQSFQNNLITEHLLD